MIKSFAQKAWHVVGWNGFSFQAPLTWQIGSIRLDYLMLVDDSGPVMEVKGGKVGGRFSHQDYLHRLAASSKKKSAGMLQPCLLPPDWQNALRVEDASGFHWQSGDVGGEGVILHFPKRRRAVLIQFYRRNALYAEVYPRILTTFHDQTDEDLILWSVFHLRAEIPKEYQLVHYRFEAGFQEMKFRFKRQEISLYCWGPASILLASGDLIRFAATRLPLPDVEPSMAIKDSGNVTWTWASSIPSFNLWRQFILKRPRFHWVRVWHLNCQNRILAVAATGSRPFDADSIEKICAAYGCI